MNKIAKNCYILFLLTVIILNSCSGNSPQEESKSSICIPPISTIAYPVGTPTAYPIKGERKPDIEPLGNWQLESKLPELPDNMNPSQIIVYSDQVWILPSSLNSIFRYDSHTHEWQTYSTIDGYPAVPRTLVLARDGHLWGIDTTPNDFELIHKFSLLSRYNENTNQFEFVKDIDDILNNVSPTSSPARIVEDQNGLLWFLGAVHGDFNIGLYSFNPSTRKAVKHLSLSQPDWFPSSTLAIDKDNSLWFYNSRPQKQLFTYSPITDQVQPYSGTLDYEALGDVWYLFFDREERLWLNNQSWLDFSNSLNHEWNRLIIPPEFLTDNGWFWYSHGEQVSYYGLEMPSQMFQSSNGWYWFTTFHGTIRLDPVKEEWCLFTTGSSPVVEDKEGNLWIAVFGKLYKYQMNK